MLTIEIFRVYICATLRKKLLKYFERETSRCDKILVKRER